MQKTGLNTYKFLKRMQKKLVVMFLVILITLIGLIGRLMYIEETSGEKYEKIVLAQQLYDSKTIPFRRGDIVDAKGVILATSVDVYNVVLDCSVLLGSEEDTEPTVAALTECFPQIAEKDVREIIAEQTEKKEKEEKVSQYIVLAKQCPYDQVLAYRNMQEEEAERLKAEKERKKKQAKKDKEEEEPEKKGSISERAVWFEKEYLRQYPYHSLAASLIGFVSSGNVGTTGIENYYDSTLNGIDGREYGYLNDDNNFAKTTKKARNGYTVATTIHEHVQAVLEEKIAAYSEQNKNGYVQGDGCLHIAALAMNPKNGEVYGMANYPTFDLNNPRDTSLYFSDEERAAKSEHELLNKLWENFCTTYAFEPGSTFKPVTVACGLEAGIINGDETYYCDGLETISGSDIHCSNRSGHGTETVQQSLMDSCNDALMQMSYNIGKDHFRTYQELFGFGKKTGIDLPGEAVGQLNESQKVLDVATNSFGQNFTCTMIQLASAFSSLINGGKYYRPHVVKEILDEEGNVIESVDPVVLKETVSEETSEKIKSYLYATVSEGTGNGAKVDGYSMGGKTGTAQKLPRAAKTYLVSFIGYVPQEDPELVLYVIIDEPNVEEQAHSSYAQELAKEMLTEILPYLNIYPDEELKQAPEEGGAPDGTGPAGEDGSTPEGAAPDESGGTGEGGPPEGGDEDGSPSEGSGDEGGGSPEESGDEDGGPPEGSGDEDGGTPEDGYGDIFDE